ncbi:MAG: ATP-binding protein [Planctomycetaceae bacterium]|nr:ATP-binding protein [Planctomycetaceae bacterium]
MHGFLVLPENRLAHAAVQRLCAGKKPREGALVTVLGPVGCGKTQLIQELHRQWEQAGEGAKVRSLTASEFAAQYAQASEAGSIPQFQNRYRRDVELLICEDIQSLGPRTETQRELVATLDHLVAHGARVLLTSARPLREVAGLSPRLINRCHGGTYVEMQEPTAASRQKLTEHFANSMQLPLSTELCEQIARQVPGGLRDIAGFLRQVTARSKQSRKVSDLPQIVTELLGQQESGPQVDVSAVTRVTARHFDLTMQEIRGPRRAQHVVLARQVAMYLTREITGLQFAEIGDYFGGRNHSTVLHAHRQIKRRREKDAVVAHHVEQIRSCLDDPFKTPVR